MKLKVLLFFSIFFLFIFIKPSFAITTWTQGNISNCTIGVGYSCNVTVSKYLAILEAEKTVECNRIGVSKIFRLKKDER